MDKAFLGILIALLSGAATFATAMAEVDWGEESDADSE